MSRIEENINLVVSELIDDLEKEDTYEQNAFNHPDKESIIDMLSSLRKIIFPGYFRNNNIKVCTLRNNISMLIEDVMFRLKKQIALVMGGEECNDEDIINKANAVTLEFIKRLRKIRQLIATDVKAAYDGDPAAFSKDEIIYSYPGLFATLVNRIAHELYLLNVFLKQKIN